MPPDFQADVGRELGAIGAACPAPMPPGFFPLSTLPWAALCEALSRAYPIPQRSLFHIACIAELVHTALEGHTRITQGGQENTPLDKAAILAGDWLYIRGLERIPELEQNGLEREVHRRIVEACRGKLHGAIDRRLSPIWAKFKLPKRRAQGPGSLAALCLVGAAILMDFPASTHPLLERAARKWAASLGRKRPWQSDLDGELAAMGRALEHVALR